MKKIALMLVLLLTASVGFNAMAADPNSTTSTVKKNADNKPVPEGPVAAASGSISGVTIAYIVGGVVVVAAAAGGGGGGGSSGTTGTH